jgi:hypothetical protein
MIASTSGRVQATGGAARTAPIARVSPAGGRRGWFGNGETRGLNVLPPPERPKMSRVWAYHHRLDSQVLDYLATRRIRPDTARRFLVGKNCRRLTIPCIVKNGHNVCYGIKKRWIGEPPEDWIDTYTMEPGSQGKAIFNYNHLAARSHPYVVIVEGVLDCMLLDQLGIPAVAPFGGGGVWDPRWTRAFQRVGKIVIVADDDEDGQGLLYAERKREMLGRGLVTFPPGGHKDMGEAYQAGERIPAWLDRIIEEWQRPRLQ